MRRRLFNVNPVSGELKTAFLANTPLAFGIAAMYCGVYEDVQESPRITMRSFPSITEAAGWLGVDSRELLHTLQRNRIRLHQPPVSILWSMVDRESDRGKRG